MLHGLYGRALQAQSGKLKALARALYTPDPTPQEAEEFGLTVDEASAEVEVWPDNQQAAKVFIAMSTQWVRAGMNGEPTGLNYASLPEIWRRTKVPPALRDDVFDDLRVMEEAAIKHMRQQAARRK